MNDAKLKLLIASGTTMTIAITMTPGSCSLFLFSCSATSARVWVGFKYTIHEEHIFFNLGFGLHLLVLLPRYFFGGR